jgi:hypothetical protein
MKRKVKLIKKIKGHWQINPKLSGPNDWDGDIGDEEDNYPERDDYHLSYEEHLRQISEVSK